MTKKEKIEKAWHRLVNVREDLNGVNPDDAKSLFLCAVDMKRRAEIAIHLLNEKVSK